ncbi:hypothetical protein PIB30_045491 [Stylosanthes scabra]|uniref:PB1 domain-containing protein n=1 Tax=Stylosanthes scabra TaxID=79078 RepID=A0ABU6YEZ9_9FABA|nr:hypothetical protein [Stylosanthes scabra]
MEIHEAKFLCSYGGKIEPIGRGNKLTYVGGINKMLYVDRRISFKDMVAEVSGLFDDAANGDNFFKYQLPGGDGLHSLVSVTNDDELLNMMLKFDQLYRVSPRHARMRLFLFRNQRPLDSVDRLSSNFGKNDVFISSRGDGTLDEALNQNQIKTFVDDELRKGDCILASLTRAIENSLYLL